MNRNMFILRLMTVVAILRTIRNWWLPFIFVASKAPHSATVRFRDGDSLRVSRTDWKVVPSLARLKISQKIRVREVDDLIQISFPTGPCFQLSRSGIFWQVGALNEVFDWDDYRVKHRNLTGMLVIDVGGFIGDSALLYASKGALVHVFEPMAESIAAMRRNLSLSGEVGERVVIHPVGLSHEDGALEMSYDPDKATFSSTVGLFADADPCRATVALVGADRYLASLHLPKVDILKIDCEGCEYDLVGKTSLLSILRPSEVVLEFHAGSEKLLNALHAEGYRTEMTGEGQIGLIYAVKESKLSGE